MKHTQEGTSLTELLISMALFLFLMFIVSRFMLAMHKNGTQLQSTLSASCALFAAIDLLERDIQSAEHTVSSWALLPGKPVWSINKNHVQWYTKKDRLIRRTGTFSKELKKWKKYTDSLIACNVRLFMLEPKQQKKKNFSIISYKIHITPYVLEGIIPIKNRDII